MKYRCRDCGLFLKLSKALKYWRKRNNECNNTKRRNGMNPGKIRITKDLFQDRYNALYLLFREIDVTSITINPACPAEYILTGYSDKWFKPIQEGEAIPFYMPIIIHEERIEKME